MVETKTPKIIEIDSNETYPKGIRPNEGVQSGYVIDLGDKYLALPDGKTLVLPSKKLAELVLIEWQQIAEQQDAKVKAVSQSTNSSNTAQTYQNSCPFTRLAFTAFDYQSKKKADLIGTIIDFIKNDSLCFFQDEPEALLKMQKAEWLPYHDFIEKRYGIRPAMASGLTPPQHDFELLEKLELALNAYPVFALVGLYAITRELTSLMLGLVVFHEANELDACIEKNCIETIWQASILEQRFQNQKWGVDEEAEKLQKLSYKNLYTGFEFLKAVKD